MFKIGLQKVGSHMSIFALGQLCQGRSVAAWQGEKKFVKVVSSKLDRGGPFDWFVSLLHQSSLHSKKKVHSSQSALVHKLTRSGFFICQFFLEKAEVSETKQDFTWKSHTLVILCKDYYYYCYHNNHYHNSIIIITINSEGNSLISCQILHILDCILLSFSIG